MFKRLRWLTIGFVLGVGSSYSVLRRLRRAVNRYAPADVRQDVHAAVTEGRSAMRLREAQLRAEVTRRSQ